MKCSVAFIVILICFLLLTVDLAVDGLVHVDVDVDSGEVVVGVAAEVLLESADFEFHGVGNGAVREADADVVAVEEADVEEADVDDYDHDDYDYDRDCDCD